MGPPSQRLTPVLRGGGGGLAPRQGNSTRRRAPVRRATAGAASPVAVGPMAWPLPPPGSPSMVRGALRAEWRRPLLLGRSGFFRGVRVPAWRRRRRTRRWAEAERLRPRPCGPGRAPSACESDAPARRARAESWRGGGRARVPRPATTSRLVAVWGPWRGLQKNPPPRPPPWSSPPSPPTDTHTFSPARSPRPFHPRLPDPSTLASATGAEDSTRLHFPRPRRPFPRPARTLGRARSAPAPPRPSSTTSGSTRPPRPYRTSTLFAPTYTTRLFAWRSRQFQINTSCLLNLFNKWLTTCVQDSKRRQAKFSFHECTKTTDHYK